MQTNSRFLAGTAMALLMTSKPVTNTPYHRLPSSYGGIRNLNQRQRRRDARRSYRKVTPR